MNPSTLRLVTYNVRYFGHALRGLASTVGPKRRIAAALLSLDPLPDIICLQEVETISLRSRVAHRSQHEEETQLEAFMGRMEQAFAAANLPNPYEAFYFRAHAYEVANTKIYTTGLAVLVNMKTVAVDSHNVAAPAHITHHHLKLWRDSKQSRICAHMQLRTLEGRRFHIFNTHLSLPTPWSKQFWEQKGKMGFGVNQLAEAQNLAQFVQGNVGSDPFVVCGDFNAAPNSPVVDFLREEAGFQNAQMSLGLLDEKQGNSFPTAGFLRLRMHLDHVFSGNAMECLDMDGSARFGDVQSRFHGLSDHVPLIARFRI